MLRRGSIVVITIGLLMGALAQAPASAATVVLESLSGSSVEQGQRVRLLATVTNDTGASVAVNFQFQVQPVGTPDPYIFVRKGGTIAANTSMEIRESVVPAQRFPQLGEFEFSMIDQSTGEEVASTVVSVTKSSIRVPRFEDVTAEAGVSTALPDFTCGNWAAGAAWGDVDKDKDLDLFLPRRGEVSHLWINNGGTFADEAAARGVSGALLNGTFAPSLGAVFADYDNDGDQDLIVTGDGPELLYQNDGTGHFTDVAGAAGIGDDGPTQSASWGDYDNDGFIDLYLTNHARCVAVGEKAYFEDRLYRNEGNGTFTDQTSLLHAEGSTLGAGFQAAWLDTDMDRDLDLYLANDFYGNKPEPNFMWQNDNGSFHNISVQSGTALTMNSMGIGIADYDLDGDLDFALSNIFENKLLQNQGANNFEEVGKKALIDRPLQSASYKSVTWGTIFGDLNNDGWEDLFLAAGRLAQESEQFDALFTNARDKTFLDHSAPGGIADPGVGRGVALADFDRDGRLDLFVVNQDGSPVLHRNTTGRRNAHWLQVELSGRASNRDGCGALVAIKPVGSTHTLIRQIFCGGTSLASGSDKAAHFGLGPSKRVARLTIFWPSGKKQVKRNLSVDKRIKVIEPN
jgi:enediyne biosynthesis protein E4